jgi:hypothetical protein
MLRLLKRWFGRRDTGKPDSPRRETDISGSKKPRGREESAAMQKLDNPDLNLDVPQDSGFDPYNTGTFNRSGSWARINRRRNG